MWLYVCVIFGILPLESKIFVEENSGINWEECELREILEHEGPENYIMKIIFLSFFPSNNIRINFQVTE